MSSAKVVALVLLFLWATLPWPLARWAALFGAFFLALGGLWSFLLSRSLVATAADPVLRTFSGRRLEVVTRLENRSPLPSGLLFVFDSDGGLESWGPKRRFEAVGPFTRRQFAYTVRGSQRGLRSLGPLTLAGSDPTGLFPFTKQTPARSLTVYPPLHSIQGWPKGGVPSGARRWEPALIDDVSRFRSYRDFLPGDPLTRLSAAAWARRGAPQVRTYDRTVGQPTGVVVDLRSARYPLKTRWALVESAVETAASLVWDLLGRGETVWLTVIDGAAEDQPGTLGPGRGWPDARAFLERLALAVPDKREDLPEWPQDLVLPPPPLRLLWVGPTLSGGVTVPSGYQPVFFPIEEGGSHGLITHP